jgi:CBS domain-containing protein
MTTAQSVLTVGDLMPVNPLVLDASTAATDAEEQLAAHAVSGAPVVDAGRGVVGVLSQTDLVRARASGKDLQECTAGELMTGPSLSASRDLPLTEVAALMASHGEQRLVVLGTDSQVIGVITAFDLIRAMALAVEGGELSAATA